MLLELVQCLVNLCSDGINNTTITRKACQCLGIIGVRDFGAVSLSPPKHYQKSEVASKNKFFNGQSEIPLILKRYRFHKDFSQTTEY